MRERGQRQGQGQGHGRGQGGRRWLFGSAAALILLLLAPAPASAHAALRATDPGDGTVLDSAPRRLTLSFTETVALLDDSVRVIDPADRPVDTGRAAHAGDRSDTVRVGLPARLADGTCTVAWRVVSADGHPVSGAFVFSVGAPSATAATVAAPTEDPAVASLYNTARYAAYGGLALLVGVTVFLAAVVRGPAPAALRGLLTATWPTLLPSTAALLLLRGPYARGTGLADALDPAVLTATLTTRPGAALTTRLALLAAAWALLRRLLGASARPHPARLVEETGEMANTTARGARPVPGVPAVALAVALALTWAAAEHASAGIQVPAAMTSSVLHLLAMSVWLGGLTALLTVAYRAPGDLTAAHVARFSRLASACAAVLALTGVYQSWRGLGSWDALTGTTYGRVLLVKLGGVTALLSAAALSRRRVRGWAARSAEGAVAGPAEGPVEGAMERPVEGAVAGPAEGDAGDDGHRRALRRSVLAEVLTGVAVLVVTTLLTITLPGRAASESASAATPDAPTSSSTLVPFDVGTPNGHGKVQLDLAPGRVGRNQLQAVVFGPDGGIVTVPELRLTLALPAQDVGPLDAALENRGGYWATDRLRLPLPGVWTMRITIRTSEIDQVTVERRVRVGA